MAISVVVTIVVIVAQSKIIHEQSKNIGYHEGDAAYNSFPDLLAIVNAVTTMFFSIVMTGIYAYYTLKTRHYENVGGLLVRTRGYSQIKHIYN